MESCNVCAGFKFMFQYAGSGEMVLNIVFESLINADTSSTIGRNFQFFYDFFYDFFLKKRKHH